MLELALLAILAELAAIAFLLVERRALVRRAARARHDLRIALLDLAHANDAAELEEAPLEDLVSELRARGILGGAARRAPVSRR